MTSNMVPLYSLADWKNGLAFKQIHFSTQGKPIIKIAELKNGVTSQTARTQQEFDPAVHLTKGDMVFSWSGNPETSIDVFWYNLDDGWLNQHIFKVTPKAGVDKQYLFYVLKWLKPRFTAIASNKQTTGLGHVTVKDLKELMVPLPELHEQQAIGTYLSTIDAKIAVNEKINDNLQQQVYALFDSWFVSFDQTDGKMPADWREGTLGEITTITSGKRPPMKQPTATTEVSIPLVGAASIMGFTNAVLYNEPILVTGRVGTHGVVQRFQSPCWTSDNTLVIKSEFYEYAFQALQRVDYVNMNRGSTQPLITQTDLKNVSIVIPAEAILLEYEKIAGTLMAMYESYRKENERLAVLRDTLLPRLMNGEIDVSDISI